MASPSHKGSIIISYEYIPSVTPLSISLLFQLRHSITIRFWKGKNREGRRNLEYFFLISNKTSLSQCHASELVGSNSVTEAVRATAIAATVTAAAAKAPAAANFESSPVSISWSPSALFASRLSFSFSFSQSSHEKKLFFMWNADSCREGSDRRRRRSLNVLLFFILNLQMSLSSLFLGNSNRVVTNLVCVAWHFSVALWNSWPFLSLMNYGAMNGFRSQKMKLQVCVCVYACVCVSVTFTWRWEYPKICQIGFRCQNE